MNKTAAQFLQDKNIPDTFLNKDDLPKYWVRPSDLMEEYAAQFAAPPPASEGEMADVETVVFFELKNKKYFTKSGFEITTDMLMKAEHFISDDVCYIKVPLATLPTSEPEERKFSQSEIEALQSSIYEITGAGEVMGLFNKMLGVNAG